MNDLDRQLRDAINGILGENPKIEKEYFRSLKDSIWQYFNYPTSKTNISGKARAESVLSYLWENLREKFNEPTLADVLRALECQDIPVYIGSEGIMTRDFQETNGYCRWELTQDLNGQTEETKKRLLELLTKDQ
jgi:hypothetical protein